jgi:hypothetical protein
MPHMATPPGWSPLARFSPSLGGARLAMIIPASAAAGITLEEWCRGRPAAVFLLDGAQISSSFQCTAKRTCGRLSRAWTC